MRMQRVHLVDASPDVNQTDFGLEQAELNITGDVSKTNTVALSMVDSVMAVGVGSRIGIYAVTALLNWSEEVTWHVCCASCGADPGPAN